jgi:hypothetical protein
LRLKSTRITGFAVAAGYATAIDAEADTGLVKAADAICERYDGLGSQQLPGPVYPALAGFVADSPRLQTPGYATAERINHVPE